MRRPCNTAGDTRLGTWIQVHPRECVNLGNTASDTRLVTGIARSIAKADALTTINMNPGTDTGIAPGIPHYQL